MQGVKLYFGLWLCVINIIQHFLKFFVCFLLEQVLLFWGSLSMGLVTKLSIEIDGGVLQEDQSLMEMIRHTLLLSSYSLITGKIRHCGDSYITYLMTTR